jgi:hypothetical protein
LDRVDQVTVTRRAAGLALLGHAAVLGFWAASATGPFAPPPLRALVDGSSLKAATLVTAVRALAGAVAFVPVGLLAVFTLRRGGDRGPVVLRAVLAEAGALVVATSVLVLWPGRRWRIADALTLVMAWTGASLGVALGLAAAGDGPSRRRMGRVGAAATLFLAAGACILFYISVEPQALSPPSPAITSADKRRVYYRFRGVNPRKIPPGRTRTLRLTGQDLSVLASWAQGIVGRDWRAAVALGPGTVRVSSSLPVGGRYLNGVLQVRPRTRDGRLTVDVERLQVGRLAVPVPILRAVSSVALAAIRRDDRLAPFLDATRVVEVQPSQMSVTYGRVDLPPGSLAEALGPALAGDVDPEAIRAHARHLVAESRRMEPGPTAVAQALRSAFRLARARSDESTPVLENKAALLALGVMLGHDRLETLVGPVVDGDDWAAIGPALRRPRMRGRRDWTRHFFVSAALTVLSAESVSDAAGLFKEELDADGGSGFSFGDLMADRAGTCFALAATGDDEAAREMQQRLAAGLRVEEIFPPAEDLPEGISDGELQREYGGVGGTAYRRLTEVIESRLPACSP